MDNDLDRLERVTILLTRSENLRLKHFAIDRRDSASGIVRSALRDFMTTSDNLQQAADPHALLR